MPASNAAPRRRRSYAIQAAALIQNIVWNRNGKGDTLSYSAFQFGAINQGDRRGVLGHMNALSHRSADLCLYCTLVPAGSQLHCSTTLPSSEA